MLPFRVPVYVYDPSTVTNTVLSGVNPYVDVPSQLNVPAPESPSEMLAAICGKASAVVAKSDDIKNLCIALW